MATAFGAQPSLRSDKYGLNGINVYAREIYSLYLPSSSRAELIASVLHAASLELASSVHRVQ